jgi:phenylpyruvate tautomerase PptA (4-oxalocrotonate tautomerase family)
MPTYTVSAVSGRFCEKVKQQIASGITDAHRNATGAHGFFAQVIFCEIPDGNHFMGGSPLKSDQIFVHGHIRAGRTARQKEQLLEEIVKVIVEAASTDRCHVWAYVSELPPSQMVEYGKVLPEPGTEEAWLGSMSHVDRERLLRIGQPNPGELR